MEALTNQVHLGEISQGCGFASSAENQQQRPSLNFITSSSTKDYFGFDTPDSYIRQTQELRASPRERDSALTVAVESPRDKKECFLELEASSGVDQEATEVPCPAPALKHTYTLNEMLRLAYFGAMPSLGIGSLALPSDARLPETLPDCEQTNREVVLPAVSACIGMDRLATELTSRLSTCFCEPSFRLEPRYAPALPPEPTPVTKRRGSRRGRGRGSYRGK